MSDSQHQALSVLVNQQHGRIAELEKRVAQLEQDNLALHKENKELKARLRAYENPHTPPSLSKKKKPPGRGKGKLGAPKGHPKYERPEPKPTKTVEHKESACPHCKHKLKKPYRIERRIIEEIPEPQPVEVTEHLIYHYKCSHCNREVVPAHNLSRGRFGPNLETHIVLSRFEDRLPLRKVSRSLKRHYKIGISNTAVLKITNNNRGFAPITPWNSVGLSLRFRPRSIRLLQHPALLQSCGGLLGFQCI